MSTRLQTLQAMLLEAPDDAFLQYALAKEHGAMGDWALAAAAFARLQASYPDYTGLYYHYALCLRTLNQHQAARELISEGIARAEALGHSHEAAELRTLG